MQTTIEIHAKRAEPFQLDSGFENTLLRSWDVYLRSVSHTSDGGMPFLQQWLSEHCEGCSGMLPVASVLIGTSTHRRISWWWWIWWQLCNGEKTDIKKEGGGGNEWTVLCIHSHLCFYLEEIPNYKYFNYTYMYQYSSIFVWDVTEQMFS